MEQLKVLEILKIFQSRLGASKESLGNDEDELRLWDAIDESIVELETPKTCKTCKQSIECEINRSSVFYLSHVFDRQCLDNEFGCIYHEPKGTE